MNKYIKNYLLSATNMLVSLLFPMITFPYISRILEPKNLGIINFVQSYGYYFTHIASFGINSYAIREISKIKDDPKKTEEISNEIFNLNLFFSLLSTVLYFSGVVLIENFRINFFVFAIYSTVILTNFLSLEWLLQSFDDYLFSTVRNFIIGMVSLIAVFVFVRKKEDFSLYVILNCIAEMGIKFSTLHYGRKTYARLRVSTRFLNFRNHIKTMFVLFIFRIVNGISTNLDKLMIGFMMSYADVGIYSAGIKIVLMLSPIIETIGIVLFPKINISAGKSEKEYYKNFEFNCNMISMLSIPMTIGLILVSGRLIPLFSGNQYVRATEISRILALVIYLGPMADLLGSKVLLVFNKDGWLLTCSVIVAISNILLNSVFIPIWGANGAAVASLLSYLVAVGVRYYYSRKLVTIRMINKKFLKYVVFTFPFVLVYLPLHTRIDTSNLWMAVFIIGCILIYCLELYLFKDDLFDFIVKKALGNQKVNDSWKVV